MTGELASGVDLWLIDLDRCAPGLVELDSLSHGRFLPEQLSVDTAAGRSKQAAHLALRLILARNLGLGTPPRRFERTPRGQPVLSTQPGERPIAFSLSHTPTHALIGCTFGTMIGVDLEHPRPIMMTPARRAIIEHAALELSQAPLPPKGEVRTLQAWVRLEALAKADGSGIGRLLTQIGAVGGPKPAAATSAARAMAEQLNLRVHDLELGRDCYGAIALGTTATLPTVNTMPHTAHAMREALGLE